ncbi:Ribonuclease H-like superfamily [Sesbania bispinosa]|nr:Ribonuclease H-like superfamily [Sesbania bispinosa]
MECGGIGILIRDHTGEAFAATTQRVSCLPDPTLEEALAIRLAIKFALETNFEEVVLESDCKPVTDLLSSANLPHSNIGSIVQDSIVASISFRFFSISHVRRNNICAHSLAKFACSQPDQYWIEECPPCIVSHLAMDSCPKPN